MSFEIEKFFSKNVRIVQEDLNGVVALYKPYGVNSMPNQDDKIFQNSLLRLPYNSSKRHYISPSGRKFFLLNRLDSPTSGIILGCFSCEIAEIIKNIFSSQRVYKEYRALVRYRAMKSEGEFRNSLGKTNKNGYVRAKYGSGEISITKYKVEEISEMEKYRIATVFLNPLTGRTHQLRVQCAAYNVPIIGDKTYGDFNLNKVLWKILSEKRLYLQSCAISFSYKLFQKEYNFEAKIPYEF